MGQGAGAVSNFISSRVSDDDEGCIIFPRGPPKEKTWADVVNVLQEMAEERRAAAREPLEIWGDIIIKGRQYQPLTVHGDMRLGGSWRLAGDTSVDGTLYTGPLVEDGFVPLTEGLTLNMTGKFNDEGTKNKRKGHKKWEPWR